MATVSFGPFQFGPNTLWLAEASEVFEQLEARPWRERLRRAAGPEHVPV